MPPSQPHAGLMPRQPYTRDDPRHHYCHAPGCDAWGAFGFGAHWCCRAHRPAETPAAAPDANAVRRPKQGALL